MDTSNPVVVSERVTLGEFSNANMMLKRQNFKELQRLVAEGRRIPPSTYGCEEVEVDDGVVRSLEASGVVPVPKGLVSVPLTKNRDSVLVSQYHPSGIKQSGAHVSVDRVFPQRKRIREILYALLKYNPDAERWISQVTFSGGTKSGFTRRLAKWADRKPKNMRPVLKEWGFNGFDILDRRMPRKRAVLDWNTGLATLISQVKVNKTSGAGPPFFQPKYRCLDEIHQVLKDIQDHISDDTIDDYLKNNPELIMSECKNKMDRYDVSKIAEKTRPYWSFSAPMSILISILCQDFCGALHTFDSAPGRSSNAYGFSWAHGGAKRMYDWMTSIGEGSMDFIVYGDDTKLCWRKGGKLFEVNPDFEQMDGSIDEDTVDIVIAWIVREYNTQNGESNFFEYICAFWRYLAIGSEFFVEGKPTYSNKTGLLTGVVGTTLFDTAKSMFAYHLYVHQKYDPMDVEKSRDFFYKMGLKVKEGTWKPTLVIEELEEGILVSEEKFLGAQLMIIQGRESLEPVPYIPREDLLKLIGNLRQEESAKPGTILQRRLFDTARGYMITGAYHHSTIWDSLCYIISNTSSEIIMQRVQAGGGKGENPELETFCGEDFSWPTSDGYPTRKFCANVYLSENNTYKGENLWIYAFPDLISEIQQYRSRTEKVNPIVSKQTNNWADSIEEEQIMERMENKENPQILVDDAEVLTKAHFRMPKNIVKFRPLEPLDEQRKEDKLNYLVDAVEEVHHQILSALLPYGGVWITQNMLKGGWFPTSHGFWTRDKTREARNVTAAWSHMERVALKQHYLGITPTTSADQPSLPEVPDVHALMCEIFPDTFRKRMEGVKIPNLGMDDVSFVSAMFINMGLVLDFKNDVISQMPSRVQVEARIRAENRVVAVAVATGKVDGKKRIMKELKRYLLSTSKSVVREEGEGEALE